MKHITTSARPCRWLAAAAALFLAISIPSLPVAAQADTKPPATGEAGAEAEAESDPSAIEIINRAIEAMGGEEAIKSIESARYTMKVGNEDEAIVRKAITVSPDLYLVKEEYPDALSEIGFDGEIGWAVSVFEDTYRCTVRLASRLRAEQEVDLLAGFTVPHRLLLILWERVFWEKETSVAGRVEFEGRECEKVVIPQPDGGQTVAYFDVATGLLAGIETERVQGAWTLRRTSVYDNWQQCGPIRLFTTLREEGGLRRSPSSTTITQFEFNTASRQDIEMPRGAIEVVRLGLLRRPESERPPLFTCEEISRMSMEEARRVITTVAELRAKYRRHERTGEAEAVILWLKWEFRWLVERMQALQERGPD